MKALMLLFTVILLSCVSRLGRPTLKGVICDFEGNPVGNCQVGEVITDSYGKFTLPEERYTFATLCKIYPNYHFSGDTTRKEDVIITFIKDDWRQDESSVRLRWVAEKTGCIV